MEDTVSLESYKKRKQSFIEKNEVYNLIVDNMIRRQSLIDNKDDVPDLPEELKAFERSFDFEKVIKHQLGFEPNKKEYDRFIDAVDKYINAPSTEKSFREVFLAKDDEEDEDDYDGRRVQFI